jgi:Type II secretory pathway, component ExeA (predicted ATPase)
VIVKNVLLTGLRGVGKTVLMNDRYRPAAIEAGWAWVGSDFSETTFLSEDNLCIRLMTDLSAYSNGLTASGRQQTLGFQGKQEQHKLSFEFLTTLFNLSPGLMVDKLKAVLEFVWQVAKEQGIKGVVFAYDESQLVSDQKDRDQYPLALLLEAFQSLQRKEAKYMLVLTGLPALFPKLVESRTYAERMFSIQEIGKLATEASRDAITVPLKSKPKWHFTEEAIQTILKTSQGYPYFIQFICREAYDYLLTAKEQSKVEIPIDPIVLKLDLDFFAGRWEMLSDRQRDLLYCIAQLNVDDGEFTIPDIASKSRDTVKPIKKFTPNDVSQMLPRLIEKGMIYKNRYGRYSFAVPLMGKFVNRKYNAKPLQRSLFDKIDDGRH